ncbi:MAG: class I SAM-dependent methyltransferase [Acidobacteriota bacterium]
MKESRGSAFDANAPAFERHRALPPGVPEAIRAAIWSVAAFSEQALVLDIGAGTGRIGRAFVEAGDSYVGVDTSTAMLLEFGVDAPNCTLMHVDGKTLPFADATFDAVLLMQVLSGAEDWRGVVAEAQRVVRPGGCIAVGHTAGPEGGVDSLLKQQLRRILEEMHVPSGRPQEARRLAIEYLRSRAARHVHRIAASWAVEVAAENFLRRHRTGARFAELPHEMQEQALNKLREWAGVRFGSLDAAHPETRNFEVDIFEF